MARLEFDGRLEYPGGSVVEAHFASDRAVTGLCGPSGVGKTSVLSMLAGLRRPTRGRIVVNEQVWFDHAAGTSFAPEVRQVGYVLQEPLLFPHLTVRDNLRYGERRSRGRASLIGWDEMIELLELGPLLARLPHTLSGGQQRRVAIGRAVASRCRLLLLDEPLNSLDAELGTQALCLIERLVTRQELLVVMVTHRREELDRLGAARVEMPLDNNRRQV